ncbi:MAG: hypothetical protein ABI067_11770 [Leifsonia sp.]
MIWNAIVTDVITYPWFAAILEVLVFGADAREWSVENDVRGFAEFDSGVTGGVDGGAFDHFPLVPDGYRPGNKSAHRDPQREERGAKARRR